MPAARRRAREHASLTSAGLDCGIIASGCPVIGVYDGTSCPVVASTRPVSARTYAGSSAYDAVGSCSGSAGPASWPADERDGSGCVVMNEP